jgi:hypothetical protein
MKINKSQMTLLFLTTFIAAPFARGVERQTAPQPLPAVDSITAARPVTDETKDPAMMEPVKSVYNNYLKIQTALAKDSLAGIPENAGAMAKAIKGDDMKMLPPEIARQSEALADAKDLKAARKAFKPLSESLIKYLADHKVKSGGYTEAYCPMAEASWLQEGKKVSNPYMGKEMLTCGEIKRSF